MFLLVILGIPGALALGHALYQIYRGRLAMTWPLAPGKVGHRHASRFPVFLPIARGSFFYTYQVGGRAFTGNRIWFGSDVAFALPNPARTWLGQAYPSGSTVQVSYNPLDPADAVLKPGVSPGTYVIAACGAGMMAFSVLVASGAIRIGA